MAKKIQLTIPKPCHEDWDAMSPVEKGKFCGSCQKQVLDFTVMSDRQIAEFFKKPSTGSVCGRFMNEQLDRDIEIPKKRIPWFKYFFSIALPAFVVSLKSSAARTQGEQRLKTVIADTTRPNIKDEFITVGMVLPPDDRLFVRGVKARVVDAVTGDPLPGAAVFLFSTVGKEKLKVGEDGFFVADIYRKITVERIEISMPGYATQKLKLADFMKLVNSDQPIKLVQDVMLVGKIAMIDSNKDSTPVCVKTGEDFIKGEVAFVAPVKNYVVSGIVTDHAGEPVAGASIVMKGTRQGVAADGNGKFTLNLKTSLEQILLVGSSVNREPREIKIDLRTQKDDITIRLDAINEPYDMGVIIVKRSKKEKEEKRTDVKQKEDAMVIRSIQHAFKVVPNPVPAGSSLNIEWKQTEEGYYSVQLLNQSGQAVHQREVWIDAEARVLNFELPTVTAGNYFLVLTNKKSGKKFSDKIVVQ